MAAEGSVVRIYMQNFMTYTDVELRPGPNLNLVLGPNGSGKSTLVCALCLGLAGKTASILRGKNISSFIRHEASNAVIEIELLNSQGAENYVIRREITRDNKTVWKRNGHIISQKEVEAFVLKLHIQVDNLCQFLPQDRVQDFARMDSKELLEGTQKAVGEPELWACYQRLLQLQSEEESLENTCNRDDGVLRLERATNQRLQGEVDNFLEHQDVLKKIEQLQQRKAWLEYYEKRNYWKGAREHRKNVEKTLKEEMTRTKPLQEAFNKAREAIVNVQELAVIKTNAVSAAQNLVTQHREAASRTRDQIDAVEDELRSSARKEEVRLDNLAEAQTSLINLEKNLLEAKATNIANIQSQIQEVEKQLASESTARQLLVTQTTALEDKLSRCNTLYQGLLSELKALQDVDSKRMEILRRCNLHAYNATVWLRQNKGKFRKPIYEPMILCLNVQDPKLACYVENRISYNDLCAFGCEDKEDMALLIRELREERRMKINVLHMPDRPDRYQPEFPITTLEQYGFFTYMKDVCSAPHAVMMFLCQNWNLHNIPIGTDTVSSHIATIKTNFKRMSLFYSGRSRYNISRSKYTSHVGVRDDIVQEASKLVVFVNPEEIRQKEEKKTGLENEKLCFQNQIAELVTRQGEVTKNQEILRQRKQSLLASRDNQRQLESRIKTAKDRIRLIESQAMNLQQEEAELKKKTAFLAVKLLEFLEKQAQACVSLHNATTGKQLVRQFLEIVKLRSDKAEAALQDGHSHFSGLKDEFQEALRSENYVKEEAERTLNEARRKCHLKGDDDLPTNLEQELSRLPKDIENVDLLVAEHRARADMMCNLDERVIQDYELRKKNIERLEAILQDIRAKQIEKRNKMSQEKENWIRPLEDLIGRINVNFGKFFARLGCAGEVKLSKGSHETDYQNYGIDVYVKFRDSETLCKLDAHRQSGGERAVSTALYMLALQELTQVPFRCVDEINQGMDPTNERKVFDLLVETACNENSAQYFLFTPKLLPKLNYSPRMQVLIVHNGRVPPWKQFNVQDILKRRAAGA